MKKNGLIFLKERFLFINISDISLRIFKNEDFSKHFKPIVYNSNIETRSVAEYLHKLNIKNIVIETSDLKHLPESVTSDIIEARLNGVKVFEVHEFYETVNKRIPLIKLQTDEYLADDVFAIGLTKTDFIIKRILDVFISIAISPIALLIIAFGGLLVFFNSPGNIFFTQERIGKNSKKFKIFKLRTMTKKHDGDFTKDKDARLLYVGKFLRRTKIDELPQIFNVLNGDMSLIGPRPERAKYVEQSVSEYAFFDLRHLVQPGITGWAQVNLPKATPKENLKKLEFDLYYIKHYSLLLDIKILFKTLKVITTLNSN